MSEWPMAKFGDLAAATRASFSMGPFGSKITKENYVTSGVPVVRGVNLGGGTFVDAGFVFISSDLADELMSANVEPGDLVFTHRGTIGQVSMIPRRPKFNRYVLGSSQVKARLDESCAIPEFYYYWFRSRRGQSSILAHISTVGVPGLATPLSTIRRLVVPRPPLSIQRAIAMLLGALDDKIAASGRIANTAEAILRLHYESTVSDASESTHVGELGYQVRSTTAPSALAESTPYIGLEHMPRGSIWLSSWDTAQQVTSAKSRFSGGDVLFGKLRPYFHKVGLAEVDGICSTDIIVIRPRASFYRNWLLFTASSDEMVSYATAHSDGTRMPRARWNDLERYEVGWPGEADLKKFNAVAAPLIDRAHVAAAESRTLVDLRDSLLPRLISGEIRIKDAERVVSGAV